MFANFMHSINRWIRFVIVAALALVSFNALVNWRFPYCEQLGILFGVLLAVWCALCLIYENAEDYADRKRWEEAEKILKKYETENAALKSQVQKLSEENNKLKNKYIK